MGWLFLETGGHGGVVIPLTSASSLSLGLSLNRSRDQSPTCGQDEELDRQVQWLHPATF